MPAGWTRVSEASDLAFWSDGEVGQNLEDVVADFYLILKGFSFLDLSIFSSLRGRSACWLDSRLRGPRFLSGGAAGVTLVVFSGELFAESMEFHGCWVCTYLSDGEAD